MISFLFLVQVIQVETVVEMNHLANGNNDKAEDNNGHTIVEEFQ